MAIIALERCIIYSYFTKNWEIMIFMDRGGGATEVHKITIVPEGAARRYYCLVYTEAKPRYIQVIISMF